MDFIELLRSARTPDKGTLSSDKPLRELEAHRRTSDTDGITTELNPRHIDRYPGIGAHEISFLRVGSDRARRVNEAQLTLVDVLTYRTTTGTTVTTGNFGVSDHASIDARSIWPRIRTFDPEAQN